MNRVQRWWLQRFLRRHRIPLTLWETAVSQAAVLMRLDPAERLRLRELTSRFLHDKTIVGAQGLLVTDEMRVLIAAQACLLILKLDFDYFDGWREVIVYPDSFVVAHQVRDESGVVHRTRRALGGESWGQGPVILSWRDAQPDAHPHGHGSNVILHEFAHKLDMLNGAANGMPPLHGDMSRSAWTAALSSAYDDLYHQLLRYHHTAIDPYAAESPAEFFAVLTETFFELPQRLQETYPAVYEVFRQFYRQDPLLRSQAL
ncbi:MAG: zinc-dependent peptidase [Gammaproteobacteria bacterium]|jgi:Mlc titration factor MtfA (ptsG expression regulator)